jgi:hypothetical protein
MVCDEISVTRSISRCLYLINELCALNVALCHTLGRQRYMQPFIYSSFSAESAFTNDQPGVTAASLVRVGFNFSGSVMQL